MDISPDGRYIVTLSYMSSSVSHQTISLWDLHNEELNEPIVTSTPIHSRDRRQHHVKFNTSNVEEIVTTGGSYDEARNCVIFYSWKEGMDSFMYYNPDL